MIPTLLIKRNTLNTEAHNIVDQYNVYKHYKNNSI